MEGGWKWKGAGRRKGAEDGRGGDGRGGGWKGAGDGRGLEMKGEWKIETFVMFAGNPLTSRSKPCIENLVTQVF